MPLKTYSADNLWLLKSCDNRFWQFGLLGAKYDRYRKISPSVLVLGTTSWVQVLSTYTSKWVGPLSREPRWRRQPALWKLDTKFVRFVQTWNNWRCFANLQTIRPGQLKSGHDMSRKAFSLGAQQSLVRKGERWVHDLGSGSEFGKLLRSFVFISLITPSMIPHVTLVTQRRR